MAKQYPDGECRAVLGFKTPEHIPAPAGGGRAFQRAEMAAGYRVLSRGDGTVRETTGESGIFETFV